MSDYKGTMNSSITQVSSDMQISKSSVVEVVADYGESVVDSNLNKRETFLQKLFPDPTLRAIKMGELKLVETEFEFRRKALAMVRETQIQALRETCNQYLVKAKAAGRAETAKFLMAKAQELQAEIDRIFEKFIESIEKKTMRLEKINNSTLKRTLEEQLDKEIQGFVEMKDQLVQKFQNIVTEGV